jgi:hypothetical protein
MLEEQSLQREKVYKIQLETKNREAKELKSALTKNESVQAHRKKYENTGKHGNIGNTVNSSTGNNGINGKFVNSKPLNDKISSHRYICMYIYVYIHTCIHICMYTYMYFYVDAFKHMLPNT